MKICAYVQGEYAKQTYSNENFNVRQWVGLSVIIDALNRHGYEVEFAGLATVHNYDFVLVSITSDCDWWGFVAERTRWQKGDYKVIVGGAGVLNVRPFLPFADYFCLGRGEKSVLEIINGQTGGQGIIESETFDINKTYEIRQEPVYEYDVQLTNGKVFAERTQGCPHKCLYCGYTWHRKYCGEGEFEAGSGLWSKEDVNRERAIIDMYKADKYDLSHLRITSIDGLSERLRYMCNKRISRDMVRRLFQEMVKHDKPHQLKIYNILGLPTESNDDWYEFIEDLSYVDERCEKQKQWPIVLHNTPFRPMPATPAACWPASYKNYRGEYSRIIGKGNYKGNIFYQGNAFWAVEGLGCDSLPTEILSMICHRGTEADSENIIRIAVVNKFWGASTIVRQITLEKYFDMGPLFGEHTPDSLPTRYLRTYCKVEKMWGKLYAGKKTDSSSGEQKTSYAG